MFIMSVNDESIWVNMDGIILHFLYLKVSTVVLVKINIFSIFYLYFIMHVCHIYSPSVFLMHLFESTVTVTAFFFICIEELEDNKHCWPGKWEKDQRRWWKVSCGLLVTNIRFLLCFCWHLWFFCVAEITVLSFRLNNQHRSLTEIRRPPLIAVVAGIRHHLLTSGVLRIHYFANALITQRGNLQYSNWPTDASGGATDQNAPPPDKVIGCNSPAIDTCCEQRGL